MIHDLRPHGWLAITITTILATACSSKPAQEQTLGPEEIGFIRTKASAITRSIDDRDPKALLRHLPSRVHLQIPGSNNQQRSAGEVVAKESVTAHLKPWFRRCKARSKEESLSLLSELWHREPTPRAGPGGGQPSDAMYYAVSESSQEECRGRIGVLFRKNSRSKFTVIGIELPR